MAMAGLDWSNEWCQRADKAMWYCPDRSVSIEGEIGWSGEKASLGVYYGSADKGPVMVGQNLQLQLGS